MDGMYAKNASLQGRNLLEQRRSSCRGAIFGRNDTTFCHAERNEVESKDLKNKIPPLRLLPWMACMPKCIEQFLAGMTKKGHRDDYTMGRNKIRTPVYFRSL